MAVVSWIAVIDPSTRAGSSPLHACTLCLAYYPRNIRRKKCKSPTSNHPVCTQGENVSTVIADLYKSLGITWTGKKDYRTQAVSGAVLSKIVPFLCLGSCPRVLQRLTNRQMREVQRRKYSREAGLGLSTTHPYPSLSCYGEEHLFAVIEVCRFGSSKVNIRLRMISFFNIKRHVENLFPSLFFVSINIKIIKRNILEMLCKKFTLFHHPWVWMENRRKGEIPIYFVSISVKQCHDS